MNIEQKGVEALPGGSQIIVKSPFKETKPKSKRNKSFLWRYGLALGGCFLTILISFIFTSYSIRINLTILVIVALIIPSWYGGRGPGLMTAIIFELVTIIARPTPPENTSVGQYIFAHFSALSLMVILVLLVSSRRNAREKLHDSEKRYRHLFENNPLPMWVYDVDTLKFLAVNDAAIFYYGYSQAEFLNMTLKDICHPDDIPELIKETEDEVTHITNMGGKHLKKDGTVIDVEISSHELVFDGKRARLILSNDVTKRKKTEDALRQLNETLEQRVAERTNELEVANKELDAFSYSVSHDLRAPLRAIDGFSKIIIEDYEKVLDEEGKKLFDVIRKNTKNMGQLIDDMLEFSRLGRQTFEPTLINMNQLAHEVFLQLESSLAPSQKIKIESLPEINGDRSLIRQVFINLLSNAVKYSRTTENALIEIGSEPMIDEKVYFVKDNGVGFDMHYAHKLFGVFQRLHSANEFEGTGVGLAIVHRIIQQHGGRVWAEGEVGKGASFYFALPLNHPGQN